MAQKLARHWQPSLTKNAYAGPRLLDVAGAFDMLPALPLGTSKPEELEPQKATGTDDRDLSAAPMVAPAGCNQGQNVSICGK